MEYAVLIQPKRSGFTAMIPALPDCHANGKTEQEAIDKVRGKIQQLLTKNKIVMLNVPENGHNHEEDPWPACGAMIRRGMSTNA
jgi:predicted RNase H-like HicB family nuclease